MKDLRHCFLLLNKFNLPADIFVVIIQDYRLWNRFIDQRLYHIHKSLTIYILYLNFQSHIVIDNVCMHNHVIIFQ